MLLTISGPGALPGVLRDYFPVAPERVHFAETPDGVHLCTVEPCESCGKPTRNPDDITLRCPDALDTAALVPALIARGFKTMSDEAIDNEVQPTEDGEYRCDRCIDL